MSRSFGGTLLTTRSPMRISPAVMFSRPAIMRSRVDLPQPDGPTSTTNWPSSIAMSTPWMTCMAPNALRTSRIATDAMEAPLDDCVRPGSRALFFFIVSTSGAGARVIIPPTLGGCDESPARGFGHRGRACPVAGARRGYAAYSDVPGRGVVAKNLAAQLDPRAGVG